MPAARKRLRLQEALHYLELAASFDPTPRTLRLLGEAQQLSGDYASAEATYRQAVSIDASDHDSWNKLGRLLVDQGGKTEAASAFRKAVDVHPTFPDAWHQLRRLEKSDNPEEELASASQAIETLEGQQLGRAALHMVAGRLCDQLERPADAYAHYKQAADSKPPLRPFSPSWIERAERVAANLDRNFFSGRSWWGLPTTMPIFVIGLPRSGTTLTEQILDAHPAVQGVGELTEIVACKHQLISRTPGWGAATHPLLFTNAGHVRDVALRHLQYLREISEGASHVVDKMPGNFTHLDVIKLMYPQAKIVHCTRDHRDVWISCLKNNLDRPYTSMDEMSEYQASYVKLMTHWHREFGDDLFVFNYESVVRDPETWIRRLIEYCELPWDDACLRFFESDRAVSTPSKLQVRRPIYSSSIGGWRRYQPVIDDDIDRFAKTSPLLPDGTAIDFGSVLT